MIEVMGYGSKITKDSKNRVTRSESVLLYVAVTKIKNTSTHKGQCGYYGFCPEYGAYFPTTGEKTGWVHIVKARNKLTNVKIPILKFGEEIEV